MSALDYIVLGGYFLLMAGIGWICMWKVKHQEDFFLGGRSFGKLLQTFAAFGAGTGANEPVQLGRTTYTSGLSGIWSVFLWLFVTPFYWIFGVWYRRMRHLTLGDWFVERYESKGLGAAYTLFGLCFYMMYLSTMFSAISKFVAPLMNIEAVPLPGTDSTIALEYVLVPLIALLVAVYGGLGGLRAAYWTDLVQGLCIIALSVILIPAGLNQLVERYGGDEATGIMDGFRIMHERMPADYFKVFEGPRAGEFPLHYIVSLTLLALMGIVVQPHFIATGGGSAKTETSARVGLVTGNFLKRLCTVAWALTVLIVLALMADNASIAGDPDRLWGVASQELLRDLNLGLVGLMLACLLAALMSSADCYMLVSSALLIRNVYAAYINPHGTERQYVAAGRVASLVLIVGASIVSLLLMDVFAQFKLALEVLIVFAAPFWLGIFWRRASKWGAWLTVVTLSIVFFVVPVALPLVMPDLKTDSRYTITGDFVETVITREATVVDVARREAWEKVYAAASAIEDEEKRDEALSSIGQAPPDGEVGQSIQETFASGGRSIFWTGGVSPTGAVAFEEVSREADDNRVTVRRRRRGQFTGSGQFQVDFLLYQLAGIDLRQMSDAMLDTLRLPPRLVTPFLLMILFSLITPRNSQQALDRYYVKMKTPVRADPEEDRRELEQSYENPRRYDHRKLFPNSGFEMQKPTVIDVAGFVISVVVCLLIIWLAAWLANLGA